MHLHMTEIAVVDWLAAIEWYRDVLGLPVLMRDDRRRFALFGDDGGRFGVKESADSETAAGSRLVFRVDDLEVARALLVSRGAGASALVDDARERFRSFRLVGPGGTPITIFAWS